MNWKTTPYVLLLFASLFAKAAQPALPPLEHAIKLQADAWDAAIINKDRRAISANMGSSFMLIDSEGATANKDKFIQGIVSEDLVISPYKVEDFMIRLYGNTAILTGTTDMHGTFKGKPFSSHYRYSDTYVKANGTWKVVHVQTTPIK